MRNCYSLIKSSLFVLSFLVMSSIAVQAQYTVSGIITDRDSGEPLTGATVYDIESEIGAVTNVDGEYTMSLPAGETTLRVSYIGYVTREFEVSGSNGEEIELDIELRPDVANLDELVVTGLATNVKRSNLANSVSSIRSEDIAGKKDTPTLDAAMQGKIPGMQITSYSGAPGGGFNVQLRGVSTLGAGSSQPLYIIDGVYIDNSFLTTGRSSAIGAGGTSQDDTANRLADINPEDIESIEVLKGASAAAIYGQRANAGVVIINTKRGSSGRTKVSYSQDIGFSDALNLIGRTDWTEERIDILYGAGSAAAQREKQRLRDAQSAGQVRDLEEEFYGNNGTIINSQLSISGGNDKTRFFISGGFKSEDGIITNTGFERNSLRANIDHYISPKIRLTSNSNFIDTESDRGFTGNQNNTGSSLGYTLSFVPNYAYGLLQQRADGTYPDNPYFSENPFRLVDVGVNNQQVKRYIQSVNANADLYGDDMFNLSLRASGGFDYLNANSIVYLPEFMQFQRSQAFPGDVIHTTQEVLNTNLEATLILNTTLENDNGNFYLATQVGAAKFSRTTSQDRIRGTGLLPGQTNVNNASQITTGQGFTETTDVGFFAQQEVNWEDRLIATVGGRFDRSTLNLQQDEYYFYPKASLAVNLANFDFWTISELEQFKLRIAYGETGGLPNFGNIFNSLGSQNIGNNVGALAPTSSVDPELKPERAKELEMGLDFSLYEGRISFTGTYYNKTVSDLILGLEPAPSTGVNSVLTNAAELENTGIELGVNFSPIRTREFSWTSSINWWTNESEVTELIIPEQENNLLGFIGFGATRFAEGVSPTALFGTPRTSDGTLTKFGDFQPDYQMSWSNDFSFLRDFELSFLWHMSQGAKNVNLSTLLTDGAGNTGDFFNSNNEITDRVGLGFSTTERWIEDASFIKLREASLFYTVPTAKLQEWVGSTVQSIQLGVSGTNLLLITDYEGYDPEVNFSGRSVLSQSVSITPFPSSRKILFHVKLDF